MKKPMLCGLAVAFMLMGCGADGPPEPPTPKATTPPLGLSISGQVQVGVSGGF